MSESVREHREQAPERVGCAVVTVSDTRVEATDRSGAIIRESLQAAGHDVLVYHIVKDEPSQIGPLLDELAARPDVDAVIINGGTGIARRDTTFEVVESRLEKRLVGFGELFRALSYTEIGAAAMLSRATAGVVQGTVMFLTPGSSNAVTLAMEKLIVPELSHVVFELRK